MLYANLLKDNLILNENNNYNFPGPLIIGTSEKKAPVS